MFTGASVHSWAPQRPPLISNNLRLQLLAELHFLDTISRYPFGPHPFLENFPFQSCTRQPRTKALLRMPGRTAGPHALIRSLKTTRREILGGLVSTTQRGFGCKRGVAGKEKVVSFHQPYFFSSCQFAVLSPRVDETRERYENGGVASRSEGCEVYEGASSRARRAWAALTGP